MVLRASPLSTKVKHLGYQSALKARSSPGHSYVHEHLTGLAKTRTSKFGSYRRLLSRSQTLEGHLLHDTAYSRRHNENGVDYIKNCATHGPEGQWSKERLRDVQCRPSQLSAGILDLQTLVTR